MYNSSKGIIKMEPETAAIQEEKKKRRPKSANPTIQKPVSLYAEQWEWLEKWHEGNTSDLLFVDLDGVLVPKWWIARQELVDQYTQRPPVHRRCVTLIMDNLRREILRRST